MFGREDFIAEYDIAHGNIMTNSSPFRQDNRLKHPAHVGLVAVCDKLRLTYKEKLYRQEK